MTYSNSFTAVMEFMMTGDKVLAVDWAAQHRSEDPCQIEKGLSGGSGVGWKRAFAVSKQTEMCLANPKRSSTQSGEDVSWQGFSWTHSLWSKTL